MADARSVIIPPEDVRKLADKAAEYVAKNGLPFEELLNKESQGNAKFCFLQHTNPYRPYYDQKVIEFSKGLITKLDEPHQKINAMMKEPNSMLNTDKELKAPSADQFSYAHPSVGTLEMDIIKHAAQFVAENGQRFLIALTEREKSNPQFEFLKPTHSLFPFFTTLIDSYSTLLNMYKNKKNDPLKLKLMTNVADKHAIFTRAGQRFEYENLQKQMKKKRDEVEEEERNKMAMIDWNDFVVVQTIDFKDDDNLPAPRDLSQAEKANKI
jgi:splicing factor 3A subunit 1